MSDEQIRTEKPVFARPPLRTRLAFAWVAVVCSSTLIGSGLGLFEMQARRATAIHSRALAQTPTGALVAGQAFVGSRS